MQKRNDEDDLDTRSQDLAMNPWMGSTFILAAIVLALWSRIMWIGHEMTRITEGLHKITAAANEEINEAIERHESSDSGE